MILGSAMAIVFQSTLSMRRATAHSPIRSTCRGIFQSTLSMRRATQHPREFVAQVGISIHALHEESDQPILSHFLPRVYFNPRSP